MTRHMVSSTLMALKFFTFMVAFLTFANGFGQVSLNGDFRIRSEYRHGFQSLVKKDQDAAIFTSQRSRITLGYKGDRYAVRFSLQDVRTWGSQSQTSSSDGLLSVHEAWIEYDLTKKISLKGGRMELAYDNHRILGNLDWAQQGRKHDLALLKFTDSTFAVHAGFAYNQDKEQSVTNLYTVPNSYKAMQFLWFSKQLKDLNISLLFLNNGTQYTKTDEAGNVVEYRTTYLQNSGYNIEFRKNKAFINSFGYFQIGRDVKNRQVEAFDISAELGFKVAAKTTISAGGEYLSGTTNLTATGTNRSFAPLYGTNHAHNGYMDYFYVGNHANNVGLQDLYLRLKQTIGKGFLGFDVHHFSSAAHVLNPESVNTMGKHLGIELDLTVRHNITKEFSIQAGYSQMLGTKTMEVLKSGSASQNNNWVYVWLFFKPDFLSKNEVK